MSCATSPTLKTIRLGGELGREFGRVHRLAISSTAEAIRALCANYPRFEAVMRASDEKGIHWRVRIGADDMASLDDLHNPTGRDQIRIMPVLRGKKSGIFEIFAGIALIAASFIPGLNVVVASMVFSVGIAMSLGGISQLLAPHPKTPKGTEASYSFAGPANTLAAGMPVPIMYGELIVGGAIISAGMTVDVVPTTQTGIPNLSALVQQTTVADGTISYQLYASWSPAGLAVAYDCTVQANGYGPHHVARSSATSFYLAVPSHGPYQVIVTAIGSDGANDNTATASSNFIGG